MKTGDTIDDAELAGLGAQIAALSRPEPPADLAQRTVDRVQKQQSVLRRFWLWKPITNPVARVAAAAVIIVALTPMTDLDTGADLGAGIEGRLLGSAWTERVESLVDHVLVRAGAPAESQTYLDTFMGVHQPSVRRRPVLRPGNKNEKQQRVEQFGPGDRRFS